MLRTVSEGRGSVRSASKEERGRSPLWHRTGAATAVAPRLRHIPPWEWCAFTSVLAVALGLRLFELGRIPAVAIHDECDNLLVIYRIWEGQGPGFFGFDWKPQPAASVYLQSLFVFADPSLFGLRLPSALFSVAALIPFYALLRRTVEAPAALIAAALLATDIWYLHFSRAGWENVYSCLFLLAAALSLSNALETGRMRSFVAVGVWAAFGAYSYTAGRTVLLTVWFVGGLALWRPVIGRRRLLAGLFLANLTTAILFAPQLPKVVSDWDYFQQRVRFLYVLGGENEAQPPLEKIRIVAATFFQKAGQLFGERIPVQFERGDRYLRYDGGAFSRLTAALIGVGMIVALSSLGRTWLWYGFFLVPFFLTQALAKGSLNGARGVVCVPVLYLFVGLTVQCLWLIFEKLYRPLTMVLVASGLALSIWSTRQYFVWVQSKPVLQALEPAVPVGDFPAWQALMLQQTREGKGTMNVRQWREAQRARRLPLESDPHDSGS